MAFLGFRRKRREQLAEAAAERAIPASALRRAGYETGVPPGGLDEYRAGVGASTQTDRRSALTELYEAYLACPWAWACVNAIARTITAGGLVMDWVTDTGEGDQEQPGKPPAVLALERLIAYCNPRENIRQVLRAFVIDLLVFGDAYLEVVWWGAQPVALYNLDSPTTTPLSDEHGNVTGYVQLSDFGQRAEFDPRDVIHVSLDAPRSGVFGVPPMQAALLPVTAWLHAAATGKEMMRKGLPPEVHADFPQGTSDGEVKRWRDRYAITNIGPRNIGLPRITKGGAKLTELQTGKILDVLKFKDQCRDEILSAFGVPPAKATVIESGNLGGGTGEEQDVTYKVDVCAPIAELVLEAFNFAITKQGFGIDEWRAKFREVDYRASEVIEKIRDMRLRNGAWVLNKYRTEIGEPPVDGGEAAVLVDRQNLVLWEDMAAMSKAMVAAKGASAAAAAAGEPPAGEGIESGQPGDGQPGGDGQGQPGAAPAEALIRYQARLREALRVLPGITEAGDTTAGEVRAQLAKNFPPAAIKWAGSAEWEGPRKVPLSKVDFSHQDEWTAAGDGTVPRHQRKLRKRHMDGQELKPVVLVRTPGNSKLVIADGHHRALAYRENGEDYVWAYVGTVDSDRGDWDTMATSQEQHGDRAA